jgi:hypothetical protein
MLTACVHPTVSGGTPAEPDETRPPATVFTYSGTPGPLAFGNARIGSVSSPRAVIVQNSGFSNLVISSVFLTGTNGNQFRFALPPLPATILPGGTMTMYVQFAPPTLGSHNGSVVLNSNVPDGFSFFHTTGTGTL